LLAALRVAREVNLGPVDFGLMGPNDVALDAAAIEGGIIRRGKN
jgi:hypothetical protein